MPWSKPIRSTTRLGSNDDGRPTHTIFLSLPAFCSPVLFRGARPTLAHTAEAHTHRIARVPGAFGCRSPSHSPKACARCHATCRPRADRMPGRARANRVPTPSCVASCRPAVTRHNSTDCARALVAAKGIGIGWSALHQACRNKNAEMASFLYVSTSHGGPPAQAGPGPWGLLAGCRQGFGRVLPGCWCCAWQAGCGRLAQAGRGVLTRVPTVC